MAVVWNPHTPEGAAFVADRPLYLNKDGTKLVEEHDASAASQFAGRGAAVKTDDAKRLGLSFKDGKVVQDYVASIADLRKEVADAEAAKAELAQVIADYREENVVKDIPNTMEAERVRLETAVELARMALAQSIKAEKGLDPLLSESQTTSVKRGAEQPEKAAKPKRPK